MGVTVPPSLSFPDCKNPEQNCLAFEERNNHGVPFLRHQSSTLEESSDKMKVAREEIWVGLKSRTGFSYTAFKKMENTKQIYKQGEITCAITTKKYNGDLKKKEKQPQAHCNSLYLQNWCLGCVRQWTLDLCLAKVEDYGNRSIQSLKRLWDQAFKENREQFYLGEGRKVF